MSAEAPQTAPVAASTAGTLVGRTLGEFRVVRLVGSGGMGEVYEADQLTLHRRVALKVLRPELVADASYLKRFEGEARVVARLNHPNIVSVLTIGADAGVHFMAMEYVDGRTLRDHVSRHGALDEKDAVAILKKAAAALQRAHDEGVIHRDVKPENILLTRKVGNRASEVKIADFGLAQGAARGDASLTQSGMTMGTPLYMSPEQVQGKPVDARSDLYSLGVTAYHLLAGEPPYTGDAPLAVAVQHVQGNAAPLEELRPELSRELCGVVRKLMAVDPAKRFASAAELLKELNRLRPVGREPTLALDDLLDAPPTPNGAAKRVSQAVSRATAVLADRRQWLWTLPLALVGSSLLGVGVAWAMRERDPLSTTAATARPRRPNQAETKSLSISDPTEHFKEASKETDPTQRIKTMWSVLDHNEQDEAAAEEATLNASVELLGLYLKQRDYDALLEVADWLNAGTRTAEQKTYGKLFEGFVKARTGESDAALVSFEQALLGGKPTLEQYDRRRLLTLANEFDACLERIGGPTKKIKDLRDQFWKRFTPVRPPRK